MFFFGIYLSITGNIWFKIAQILTCYLLYWLSNDETLLIFRIRFRISYRFIRVLSCEILIILLIHFWFTNPDGNLRPQIKIWAFFRIDTKSLNIGSLRNFARVNFPHIIDIFQFLRLFLPVALQQNFWRSLINLIKWSIFSWL